MRRKVTETLDPDTPLEITQHEDGRTVRHPSFGHVSINRTQGRFPNMVGVDFEQGGAISFTISTAKMERSLSSTRWYEDQTLIKFYMSEVQFAKMITGLNGVQQNPVTLEYASFEGLTRIPPPPKHMMDFDDLANEAVEGLEHSLRKMQEAAQLARELALKKSVTKADLTALVHKIDDAYRDADANHHFRVDQAKRSISKAGDRTKMEIVAYLAESLRQLGAESLAAKGLPATALRDQLEDHSNPDQQEG